MATLNPGSFSLRTLPRLEPIDPSAFRTDLPAMLRAFEAAASMPSRLKRSRLEAAQTDAEAELLPQRTKTERSRLELIGAQSGAEAELLPEKTATAKATMVADRAGAKRKAAADERGAIVDEAVAAAEGKARSMAAINMLDELKEAGKMRALKMEELELAVQASRDARFRMDDKLETEPNGDQYVVTTIYRPTGDGRVVPTVLRRKQVATGEQRELQTQKIKAETEATKSLAKMRDMQGRRIKIRGRRGVESVGILTEDPQTGEFFIDMMDASPGPTTAKPAIPVPDNF